MFPSTSQSLLNNQKWTEQHFDLNKMVLKKRNAIFCHQSQKDGVMFQGNDNREFWLRAEQRNRLTANKYHSLGMADYEAIEAFKRYKFH